MVEKFFEKKGGKRIKDLFTLKQGLIACGIPLLGVEQNFMQSLSALLVFFGKSKKNSY